jgi:D-psicose/D-tagatose/L-ribulose 3-epimerase
MKKCISNIAWEPDNNNFIISMLKKYNIKHIEVAPSILFKNPALATKKQILDVKQYWNKNNINLYGMQSLLYGNPDLTIFNTKESREDTFNYLKKIIKLAGLLGIKRLVFGSPKNRFVKNLPTQEAREIGCDFFWNLSELCAFEDIVLCIEPNAKEYGCNFINNTTQALSFVEYVNHNNFKLNMDTSTMIMNEENIEECIMKAIKNISHFHLSFPNLGPIKDGLIDFYSIFSLLSRLGYDNAVSVEMRPTNNLNIEAALKILNRD